MRLASLAKEGQTDFILSMLMTIRVSFLKLSAADKLKMRVSKEQAPRQRPYRQGDSFPSGGMLPCTVSRTMRIPGSYL